MWQRGLGNEREGEAELLSSAWSLTCTVRNCLNFSSFICLFNLHPPPAPFHSFIYINFLHFAQFSPYAISVFILINLSDSWMSYSASLLQILFIFMFVFIFHSPSSLPLPPAFSNSNWGCPQNWRHVIDAFLMRILGHELNAIYCGKWQVQWGERKWGGAELSNSEFRPSCCCCCCCCI